MATFSFLVSTTAQLNAAIASINSGGANSVPGVSYYITLTDDITLTASIAPINLAAGCSLTVTGNSGNPRATIDGQGAHGGFVALSGAVTLDRLTITATVAKGGAGGNGALAGGGGAGLGGGVFVASGASVVLSNVNFTGDSAAGGTGGSVSGSGVGAGGASSDGVLGAGGAGGVAGDFGGGGGMGASGGFGAGSNAGGGLGAGGDVFVEQGGTLTISGGTLGAGHVLGGGAHKGGAAGSAFGSGIFIQGDQSVSIANATVSGVIADQAGSGGTGAGAVDVSGDVTLSGANTFSGGLFVAASSVLVLGNAQAAGGGAISLSTGDRLNVLLGDTPANAILGFTDASGDKIDLANVGLATTATINATNQVTFSGGTVTPVTLNLDQSANYSNDTFLLQSDNSGGTLVQIVQTTFNVASEADLNAAIEAIDLTGADSHSGLSYTINITGSFTLATDLDAINLAAGDRLTINGHNKVLNGAGNERGFYRLFGHGQDCQPDDRERRGDWGRGRRGRQSWGRRSRPRRRFVRRLERQCHVVGRPVPQRQRRRRRSRGRRRIRMGRRRRARRGRRRRSQWWRSGRRRSWKRGDWRNQQQPSRRRRDHTWGGRRKRRLRNLRRRKLSGRWRRQRRRWGMGHVLFRKRQRSAIDAG